MAGLRRGRRGAAAMIVGVFALMVAAPAIATPAGAARVEMAAKHHRHRHRRATALKGGGSAAQLKSLKANAATSTSSTTLPPLPNFSADAARLRGIVAGRQPAAKKLLLRVRPKVPLAVLTPKHKNKHKVSPLPLPELFLAALAPFVLMGAYLLGSDHLRRREPRRRRASLVITPARDG